MFFEVLKYITLNKSLLDKLNRLDSKDQEAALRLGKRLANDLTIGTKQSDIVNLAAALKGAEETLLNY